MKRRLHAASAGVVMTALGGVLMWPSPAAERPTAVVRRGPFVHTLVTRGTVGAARVHLYASTIAGAQAKILDIVPEGQAVSAGDVLVRFDAAPFEEAVLRETGTLAQAEAELVRARADLRIEEMRAGADAAAARAQIGFADAALANERDGRGPLLVAEARAAVGDAARQLQRAQTAVDDLRALLANGFATRAEVERAEQAQREAEERRRIAALKLQAVETFEQPAALEKARAEAAAARTALTATTDAVEARLAQRRAAVALAEGRVNEARLRLANARAQVERSIVRAETPGLVVYRELFFGTDRRRPQPGDEVWPNQPLVAIPDPAQLVVETRVRETDLHSVTAAAKVTVTVDALPNVSLTGDVSIVGALAQEEAGRAGRKFFPVTIRLLTGEPRLRTGMTARIELTLASLADELLVPLDAIVEDGGKTWCHVQRAGRSARRVVEVVGRNEQVAAVRGELAAGELVHVFDPSAPQATGRRP